MLGSIFLFLLIGAAVLGVLIIAHEFGHFLMAKRVGVWVEEFGLGLPPRLFGKKIGDTIYSINLFPLGGFVRLHGELKDEGLKYPKRAFLKKSKKARFLITAGGIIGNFLLAIVAFGIVYSSIGVPREGENVRVVRVSEGSPAAEAGLMIDDLIREVNGQKITATKQFVDYIKSKESEVAFLRIERGAGNFEEINLTPRKDPPEGEGPIGVAITTTETYFPPLWQRPFIGVYYGTQEAIYWAGAVVFGLGSIAGDVAQGQEPEGLAGPVGILAIISEVARLGFIPLTNLIGIISVNLAILNLVPFPPLDGSRILSIGVEAIFGKRILPKVEAAVHAVGMVVLIILILLLTSREIPELIKAGSVSEFVESYLKIE
ncbi:MAG: RIP metalloprotease [Patescibacteria group bacterium]